MCTRVECLPVQIYVAVDCHPWEIGRDAHIVRWKLWATERIISFVSQHFLHSRQSTVFYPLCLHAIYTLQAIANVFFSNKGLIQKEHFLSGNNENFKRRYFKYQMILDVYNLCIKLHLFEKNIKISSLINWNSIAL